LLRGYLSHLHAEFLSFQQDSANCFGRLFCLGEQDNGGNSNFKSIMLLKRVFGIEAMKKDYDHQDGDGR
jgi:hypothetical protein